MKSTTKNGQNSDPTIASHLIPSENFQPNAFSIEKIMNFLTMEETFKGSIIDDDQHDIEIRKETIGSSKTNEENPIPRFVVRLEKFYDLQDKFKGVTNCKTQSFVMQREVINLGTIDKPHNINLRVQCTPSKKDFFIRLFKEYKDGFAWSYEDLKTFDTQIMQHMIPIKEGTNPLQQKLSKMHPILEPMVKAELNKLLAARIVFIVRHTQWVANLVPIQKKNGDIRLCVDFRNLNQYLDKYAYPIPSME